VGDIPGHRNGTPGWGQGQTEIAYLDAFSSSYPIVRLSESFGKITLVTRNKRHFAMIDGLILQVPDY
jgi:hypothetical protein